MSNHQIIRLGESPALENSAEAVFAVPGESVLLRSITVDSAERRYLKDTLPYLLEDQLIADVESQHFVSVNGEEDQVNIAVVEKQAMEGWREQLSEQFSEKRLQPEKWIPEPLLLTWQEGQLVVVIESERAVVRIAQSQGFACELEMLAEMLQIFCDNSEVLPEELVLYAGRELEEEAARCYIPDILQGQVRYIVGDYRAAVTTEQSSGLINLLQGAYMPQLPWQKWWQYWRSVAVLFAVALLLQLGTEYFGKREAEQQNLVLRQQIEQRAREVLPRGNLVDPERQVRNQLNKLKGGVEGIGFVSMLNRVGSVISSQDSVSIDAANFNSARGNLQITLNATDFSAVEAVRSGLENIELVAELQNSNANDRGVRARIQVREK